MRYRALLPILGLLPLLGCHDAPPPDAPPPAAIIVPAATASVAPSAAASVAPSAVASVAAPAASASAAPVETTNPPRGDVQVGTHTATAPISDASRVIAGLRPKMRSCYRVGLESDPTMRGSMKVVAKVNPAGEVDSSVPVEVQGLSLPVAMCIARVIRNAQFAATGTTPTLTIPVRFEIVP